jgi:hypothetical protein
MTTPDAYRWGSRGLQALAENFVGQEHVGILGSLLMRLARFLGGDPSAPISVTSTGTGNPQLLPDNTPALSAVLHVTGNNIIYRMDGQPPAIANDPVIQVGSIITITGRPSLRGFQFASAVAGSATLTGSFYD